MMCCLFCQILDYENPNGLKQIARVGRNILLKVGSDSDFYLRVPFFASKF